MSILKRLFGGGDGGSAPAPGEEYNGYVIRAEPMRDGQRWRIAARIEKEIDGETRSHHMIRADTLESEDAAAAASVEKAKMLIDEQGKSIFT